MMLIRVTKDEWINFDKVEKITVFDDTIEIFYNGYKNTGVSIYIESKEEGIKAVKEISRRISVNELVGTDPENLEACQEQPPIIKSMKFNEDCRVE